MSCLLQIVIVGAASFGDIFCFVFVLKVEQNME